MEHILFHLIVEGIQALDRRMQKPLGSIVPELHRLRGDPAGYLRQTPVIIGPRQRRALAAVIGLISGAVTVGILIFVLTKFQKPFKLDPTRIVGLLVSFGAVALAARAIALRLLRGATLTLRHQGVEVEQDEERLFLPWDLFFTAGAVFEADHKNVVLPINPLVPVGVAASDDEGNEQVRAVLPDNLESSLLEFDEGQMALKDLYEVRLTEIGELLHEIGHGLGATGASAEHFRGAVPPLAVPEEKGWLRIHLTQLPFPPVCAGCGAPTVECLELPVAAQRRSIKIDLPCCDVCQRRRSRARWIGLWIGLSVGLLAGVICGYGVHLNAAGPNAGLIAGLLIGLFVSFPVSLIAMFVARDMATPVACKDYKPEKGTVMMRFRRPDNAAGLIAAMGVPIKYEPAS